jgi:hypothetical protein
MREIERQRAEASRAPSFPHLRRLGILRDSAPEPCLPSSGTHSCWLLNLSVQSRVERVGPAFQGKPVQMGCLLEGSTTSLFACWVVGGPPTSD